MECNIESYELDGAWVISSLDELHTKIGPSCTTVVGSIGLNSNFTGPFVLNGITNFTGFISSSPSTWDSENDSQSELPNLTSFEMQDLVSMGSDPGSMSGIILKNVPALTSVVVPKATYVSELYFERFSSGITFDFPMLVNSSGILISGNITRLHIL